jgi:cyclopropane-fatty-acyl-phospholipid synthase
LEESEVAALEITCDRAELRDGQRILELGCGWGSLSIWMAERLPNAEIVAITNSRTQRRHVENLARARGLSHLRVEVGDMNDLDPTRFGPPDGFDRIVSIEMLEHMRNHEAIFARMANWLRPDGKVFAHIFSHRAHAYTFDTEGPADWMAQHFFTGGMMPSDSLFPLLNRDLRVAERWTWDGTHYERTALAWLNKLDLRRARVLEIFQEAYGESNATRWLHRWRMFFLAVAELFGFAGGAEWHVTHYLLEPDNERATRSTAPCRH